MESTAVRARPPENSGEYASPTMMTISNSEFNQLREFVYDKFGINLTEQKRSLVVGRLQKYIQSIGHSSFDSYFSYLTADKSFKAHDELINRISTNFSYFYRENAHFDFFTTKALPELIRSLKLKNSKDIRIWTAGCSTGEEPYMLLMLMMEYLGIDYPNWNAGLLATDISNNVLTFARQALYPADRTTKVPKNILSKYFTKRPDNMMAVSEKVKKELTLRRFNLMNTVFPFKEPFHMIFCRNVMIYFDKPTRDTLVAKYHKALAPGGYLFIGHSETIGREQSIFKYIMPACYQKI
nr:protein-glutamate O-methyltransferase CheR [Desulfobulbaceae bacterium]